MSFWANQKVLVTGGAGFLGFHVVQKLKSRGCEDIFIPRSREYDLVNMEAVKCLYDDAKPDIVIHLAARVGGIGANRDNPGKFFYDNLMMGAQLMEVGRYVNVKKFVGVGTICAYPKLAQLPFKEEDIWSGFPEETNASYGLAKKMLLVQSQAYRKQYGFNSIVLFPVNLYGPRDNFNLETSHVIPALIRKCIDAQSRRDRQSKGDFPITLWGTGTPTREFLYVDDAAEGILLAAEHYNKSKPVNLGINHEISIKELAILIANLTGFSGEIIWDATKPDGQPRRCVNASKAKREFGFSANVSLREGLEKTISWFKSHQI